MNKRFLAILIVIAIIIPSITFAQTRENTKGEKAFMHKEEIDDLYVPGTNDNQKTSPAYSSTIISKSSEFFMTQVNTNEDGENILNDAANEPSIAIDPTNPDRMFIGWRQFDDVTNNN